MKILLVDDDAFARESYRTYLESLMHEVITAADGAEAVKKLYGDSVTLDQTFDAVITDMQMPKMTGLELLQYLQRRKADLPCLLHSGSAHFSDGHGAIDLKLVMETFKFARFNLKNQIGYIESFLEEVSSK